MTTQWKLLARCPAGPSPRGWTEMRVYETPEGPMVCMATVTPKQDTCDPQTYGHISREQLKKLLETCRDSRS